ncbi:hypothetical protein PQX77_012533 [Marasmius sp. AFHP31]|nr:hypothetical protein PQX77_012533 [Marasmius sp. AFHP31]
MSDPTSCAMHTRTTSFINSRNPPPQGRTSSFQGGGDNPRSAQNESDLTKSKWEFNSLFGQIVHTDACDNCKAFLRHTSDGALEDADDFKGATRDREDHIISRSAFPSLCRELENEVSRLKTEVRHLSDQIEGRKRADHELKRDYDDLNHSYESARTEIGDMGDQIAELTEAAERGTKRRRTNAPDHTRSSTADRAAMVVDDEGGPPVPPSGAVSTANTAPTVPQSSSGTVDRFTEKVGAWDVPKTVGEAQALMAAVRKAEEAGEEQPCYRAFKHLRKAHTTSVKVEPHARSDFDLYMIKNYWVPDGYKNPRKPGEPSKAVVPTNNGTNDTSSSMTNADMDLSTSERSKGRKGKAKNVSKPPLTTQVPTFDKNAPLNEMLACVSKEVATEHTRAGVVVYPDGSISIRSVRGMRLCYQRSPPSQHGTSPAHRHLYVSSFVEMVLTPNLYRDHVDQNPLPDTAPPLRRYPKIDANVNAHDLAEFMRKQGITPAEVDDAALWAVHWLQSVKYTQFESRLAVQDLRRKLYGLMDGHGVPTGLNDNAYYPNGHIIERPSSVIQEIPGRATFNDGTVAGPSGSTSTPPVEVVSAVDNTPSENVDITPSTEGADVEMTSETQPEAGTSGSTTAED